MTATALLRSVPHRQRCYESRWKCRAPIRCESLRQTIGRIRAVSLTAIVNTGEGDSCRRAQRKLCVFLIASSCIGFFAGQLMAQGINSATTDTFRNSSKLFNRSNDPNALGRSGDPSQVKRYSSTGKPCIALESFATAQLINKNIYEHWIKASNSCGQNIKVQVCYRKTTDCIIMTVPPWETKNAVLGIQPSLKEFQYDAKEK
jgi:hypothetical protein